ncbi:MAG: hypothetical protein V2J62_04000 [candidate division KSB1 bacterium]|jgi:hypothetical protein|nr:hypothetical protein [candidate division KSB1 bacterium]
MKKIFKDIGFFIVVLGLAGLVFWLLHVDKKASQSALESALRLLGEDLLTKVQSNEKQDSVKQIYDQFIEDAVQKKVPPEKIEQLAANILNLSNVDTLLTPDQAEAIMEISLSPLPPMESDPHTGEDSIPPVPGVVPSTEVIPKELSAHEWEELGERIQILHTINRDLRKSLEEKRKKKKELEDHLQVEFNLKDDLKMKVSPRIYDIIADSQLYRSLEGFNYVPVFDIDSLRATIKLIKYQSRPDQE